MSTSKRALLLTLLALVAVAAYAEKLGPKPQEVFAPYWTSEPGWDTELQLKNNLASGPLTATPVLRVASGEEIPLDPVTIASNASVSVWVNEGLLKHSPSLLSQPGSFGSVVFHFTSLSAMNLYATAVPSIAGRTNRVSRSCSSHTAACGRAGSQRAGQLGRNLVATTRRPKRFPGNQQQFGEEN